MGKKEKKEKVGKTEKGETKKQGNKEKEVHKDLKR